MQAIGQRNKVEYEVESRRRKRIEIDAIINEKLNELDRYTQQYESLLKVEQEQLSLIDSLSKGNDQ
jgi:intraflagellar transport protein 20